MNQSDKDKRNEAIALYMGAKIEQREIYLGLIEPCAQIRHYINFDLLSSHDTWIPIARMKYNSSLDWIMPVVEKINKSNEYDVIIYRADCHINDQQQIIIERSVPQNAESLIMAVFLAVSDYCLKLKGE